jgi:hypothetical protein
MNIMHVEHALIELVGGRPAREQKGLLRSVSRAGYGGRPGRLWRPSYLKRPLRGSASLAFLWAGTARRTRSREGRRPCGSRSDRLSGRMKQVGNA